MTLSPIVKRVTVECNPERAFRYFTNDFDKWWPGKSHSVSAFSSGHREVPAACILEPRNSGRIFEKGFDANEYEWGTIFLWEPPQRLAFTWHPGKKEETGHIVEVTFVAVREGTLVTLTHSGWTADDESSKADWNSYNNGWETVFVECYARGANAVSKNHSFS